MVAEIEEVNVIRTPVLPSVTVVVPAHKRPIELRRAIDAIREQDFAGEVDVVVVFDRAEPDLSLVESGSRPVRVLSNSRTPGLAGARNTGILAGGGDLIAFCDDDDVWMPDKLTQQVALLSSDPDAPLVTTSIVVNYGDQSTVRLAGTEEVSHEMLLGSRMSMLHSSTLLFRREALLGPLGLINEEIPGSQNEDWDILLRSSAIHPILHVDVPLVQILWGTSSYFSRRWDTKIASSIWMLENHADIAAHRKGSSRLMGQIAFAFASEGERREAWRWAGRSLKNDPLQWRSWVASGVAVAPRSSELVLSALHRFGRGV